MPWSYDNWYIAGWESAPSAQLFPISQELREDQGSELREDGTYELREPGN